ncbi:MAG: O-antigen ligase family protein, partial [Flavobacteriales bacterium]
FDFGVKKEDNSGGTRIALFFRTLDLVKTSKALGMGGGQAQAIIHSEGGLGKHHDSSVHNYWLEYLAEGGIVAELLFITFYWILLVGTWLDYRRHGQAAALMLFITLLLFFVGSISLSSCIYFLPMYLLFGITGGYLISRPYALHLSLKYPFIVATKAEHIARS